MSVEGIVYLLRNTNLTLDRIGELSPDQFNAILEEVIYQEKVKSHREEVLVASMMAAMYNSTPKKKGSKTYSVKDFMTEEAPSRQRESIQGDLKDMAKKKGVILPNE